MIGTIISYDPATENGVLQSTDGVKFKFTIMDCYEFDKDPQKGDPVKFGLENGELYFVELSKDSIPSSKSTSDENSKVNKEQVEEKVINENIYDKIELSYSVGESIEKYFSKLVINLDEYDFDFTDFESLDYIKMRRFLNTAYHNMMDLDPRFIDKDLEDLHDILEELYKLYRDFLKRLSIPQSAYDEMFLNAQPEYVWRRKRLESNRGEMITQKGKVKNISNKMKLLQQKINQHPDNEVSLQNEYKRLNSAYVDTLHDTATLREQNEILSAELASFEKAHYEEFISHFTKFAREKKQLICRLMDGYAYFFDKKMWECAEQSKPIQEFFRKANVQEEFSSKTYLKYYLKGLDELKMGPVHKELKTLLDYLESLTQVSVVIIDENRDTRSKFIHLFRTKGSDIKVSAYERVGLFHQRLKKENVDLLLIDINTRNPDCKQSIEMIHKIEKTRTRKCRICLMANSFTKEQLYEYNQLGVLYFLPKISSNELLSKNVDELLADLGPEQYEEE